MQAQNGSAVAGEPMRFGLVAILGLMAGAGSAVAQQANDPNVPLTMTNPPKMKAAAAPVQLQLRYPVMGVGCPGQLMARQQAAGAWAVWTIAQEDFAIHGTLHGLGIHVEFATPKTPVKSVELRVSYLPSGPRYMLVDPKVTNTVEKSPEERTKTFDLEREAAMRIGGDLLVGPAATITSVHLMSATYADGSVWRASSDDQCTIVPSKYMLIEAKR